ncbi:MAG TPA: hypothetical protein VHC49_23515 [Mycobacteriales bacterium]|nr:hypothetical protein [Mycobacteriales bacterium]
MIFPIGHFLGIDHQSGDDSYLVRIGWDIYRLGGVPQLTLWALAHGLPEGAGRAPWTRAGAEGAARASGLAGAESIMDDLADRDLVVEIDPDSPDAVEFTKVCRVRSLLCGLGDVPGADPPLFDIGPADGKALAQVPALAYELWKWGHACDSLWQAGEFLAAAGLVDPAEQLPGCLAATQLLLAQGAAYLDEARAD